MGCNSSKAVAVSDNQPVEKPQPRLEPKVPPALVVIAQDSIVVVNDKLEGKLSTNSEDSGCDQSDGENLNNNIKNTATLERTVSQRIPDSPESSSGSSDRDQAPVVSERPSSRGGLAFDITYDSPRKNGSSRMNSLQKKSRSQKKELTIEELKNKLETAEVRRKDYESRLVEKMAKESNKISKSEKKDIADISTHFKSMGDEIRLNRAVLPPI